MALKNHIENVRVKYLKFECEKIDLALKDIRNELKLFFTLENFQEFTKVS